MSSAPVNTSFLSSSATSPLPPPSPSSSIASASPHIPSASSYVPSASAASKLHIAQLSEEDVAKLRQWAIGRVYELTLIKVDHSSTKGGKGPFPNSSSSSLSSMSSSNQAGGGGGSKFSTLVRRLKFRPGIFGGSTSSSTSSLALPVRPKVKSVLFGNPLASVLEISVSETSLFRVRIPMFIEEAMKFLCRQERLKIEGIFRVPGSMKRVLELRAVIDTSLNYIDYESVDLPSGKVNSHDITTVIKQFLRELPLPLLGNDFETLCVEIEKIADGTLRLQLLQLFYITLPTPQRDLFETIFRFLNKVARHRNKMTATNLALVFAPSFLSINSGDNLEMHRVVVSVLRLVIIRVEEIFRVDLWVAAQENSKTLAKPLYRRKSERETVVSQRDLVSKTLLKQDLPVQSQTSGKLAEPVPGQASKAGTAVRVKKTDRAKTAMKKAASEAPQLGTKMKEGRIDKATPADDETASLRNAKGHATDDYIGTPQHLRSQSARGDKKVIAALEVSKDHRNVNHKRSQSLESIPVKPDDHSKPFGGEVSDGELSELSD